MPLEKPNIGPCVAVIDVGTNSTKLVVARGSPATGDFSTTSYVGETSRIGEGLESSGVIGNTAQLRTITALERFQATIRQHECDAVFAFSTYALRKAGNAAEVVQRIKKETGIGLRVLSGEEEARYAYLSARHSMATVKAHSFLIDVGGGSTEFVHASGDRVVSATSLPLGALRLTERYVRSDPVSQGDLRALRDRVSSVVSELRLSGRDAVAPPNRSDLVASGGSAAAAKSMLAAGVLGDGATAVRTAIAASAGAPAVSVRIGDLRRLQESCISLPLSERRRLAGLNPAWADIIVAGLVVVLAFMDTAKKRVLRINEGGVREGVALHVIQNNLEW